MFEDQPWVEKYRPSAMSGVVLDETNQTILDRIVESGQCPHLLLHGPPGTGKTTTAINLVNEIHARHGDGGRECLIHLNASDERGVDVVRQQIARFVDSEGLFKKGSRFVILDEVDYMTKCAQQGLRRLIQGSDGLRVTFCLVCNYATRIDASLREEFVPLRFDRLPPAAILDLLQEVAKGEQVPVSAARLSAVRVAHGSDIRSMINHLQTHQDVPELIGLGTASLWESMQDGLRSAEGVSADAMLQGARDAGTSMGLFARSLVDHAVRSSADWPVDGERLLDLAVTIATHHYADEGLIAALCSRELHGSLSPHRSARCRSRSLQELGGVGDLGNPNSASLDSSGSAGPETGMGSGADTADML